MGVYVFLLLVIKSFKKSLRETDFLVPKNEPQCSHFRQWALFLRYGQFHLKYPLFRQKMMSLLLTVTLQVFKI